MSSMHAGSDSAHRRWRAAQGQAPARRAAAAAEGRRPRAAAVSVHPARLRRSDRIMLFNSVHDDTLLTLMPKTTAALASWDGKDLPDEATYAALVEDLKAALEGQERGRGRQADQLRASRRAQPGALERAQGQQAHRRALQAGHDRDRPDLGTAGRSGAILKRGGSAYTPLLSAALPRLPVRRRRPDRGHPAGDRDLPRHLRSAP